MMTRQPLRLLALAMLCFCAWRGFAAEAPTVEAPAAPEEIEVELHFRDRTKLKGVLKTRIFPIKVDYGTQEIEASHVEVIDFRPPEAERTKDRLELHDNEHVRGFLRIRKIDVETDEAVKSIALDDLRQLKVIHKHRKTSLSSIILGLVTLTAMEIVLGIDNIIFLAIVAGKLPPAQQPRARKIGLVAALGTRLMLLASLSFLLGLTRPLFTLPEMPLFADLDAREISLRDIILLAGGMFLIGKSTMEMHEKLEEADDAESPAGRKPARTATFGKVLIQIAVLDIVFSLDSVITAVGMVDELWVMMTAMVLSMFVMLAFAGTISDFVTKHPTLKILALSFLILIGVLLVAESLGQHVNKGYIYFAMAFAVIVEMINLKLGGAHAPVKLHHSDIPAIAGEMRPDEPISEPPPTSEPAT